MQYHSIPELLRKKSPSYHEAYRDEYTNKILGDIRRYLITGESGQEPPEHIEYSPFELLLPFLFSIIRGYSSEDSPNDNFSSEERKKIIDILKEFEDLFGSMINVLPSALTLVHIIQRNLRNFESSNAIYRKEFYLVFNEILDLIKNAGILSDAFIHTFYLMLPKVEIVISTEQ